MQTSAMNSERSPQSYLNTLPFGAIIVQGDSTSLNHKITFINQQFEKEIGWSLTEIPDKNTWWQVAYPDPEYQKVVERQWELCVESFDASEENFIYMDADIRTKFHGTKRFRVYYEAENHLIPNHYIVFFVKLD